MKLVAPDSAEEIDSKIAELREREALFERACSEEVNEQDQNLIEKIKGKSKKDKKKEKKAEDDDFPAL